MRHVNLLFYKVYFLRQLKGFEMSLQKQNSTNDSSQQKRLKLLEAEEIKNLFSHPLFNLNDQEEYFSLSPSEQKALETFKTLPSKIIFILQLGYFKSHHLFFDVKLDEAQSDITYIVNRYFLGTTRPEDFYLTKKIRSKQKKSILSLCGYKIFCHNIHQKLELRAREAACISSHPLYVFRSIMTYLLDEKIVSPAYSTLQSFVGKTLTYEQNRLSQILQKSLTVSQVKDLNSLLENSSGLHIITQIKRDPRDFTLTEIKHEIERGKQIKDLYDNGKTSLKKLQISPESIKYYAYLVSYYSVFSLKRFSTWKRYLYLMCFVHHRYQQHHDNLIECFLFYVRKFYEIGKETAKEKVYQHRIEINQNLQKAGQVIKLFTEEDIPQETLFCETQKKAFAILGRDQLVHVADEIASTISFDERAFQWEAIEALGMRYKRYLRPLLLAIPLEENHSLSCLIDSLDFLKKAFIKGDSFHHFSELEMKKLPLSEQNKKYLYRTEDDTKEKVLIRDRYEFYLYRLLRNHLEAGDIFCRESSRFRSFEDDLIDETTWKNHKDDLIKRSHLEVLNEPIESHLADLEAQLETSLSTVNQRIAAGDNKFIKITKKKNKESWTLLYDADSDTLKVSLLDTLPQASIGNVLRFTQQNCHFMDAFDHVLGRYVKNKADENALFASLIAWGTNTGLGRMGQVSDLDYITLSQVSDNFIRLETLHKSNDIICHKIAQTAIFEDHNIDDQYHSSSDGQKFETSHPTFNARYSPKYFGLKKGVVSYSMVLNHIPFWAKIIGANEHESHYVFDILYNNTSDIVPKIHSTDTHGTNEVNFAILHVFGYQFAPRYRNIVQKMKQGLYSFNDPVNNNDFFKPVRKINKQLIIENWDWIQRIMVSLALKQTTQNIITSKLSSYARQNKTQKALWEYDNIFTSLYLLRYVDTLSLRKNVQKALNRGESYNKLRKAVAFANFGKLRFKNEHEQQIWQECSRLMTNCILYYNAVILSKIKEDKEEKGDIEGLALLKKTSLAAWQHINLYGRYEFTKNEEPIDLKEVISPLLRAKVNDLIL